jgi:signal transduction histidine kinase
VRLPEFARTTTIRRALAIIGMFGFVILLSFGFVYVRTTTYMVARVDAAITEEADVIAEDRPAERLQAIEGRLRQDPRRIRLAGLFDPDGKRLVGNIEQLPPALQENVGPQRVPVVRIDALGRERQTVRATTRRLPDGETLVIARNIDENAEIAEILWSAMLIGLAPALGLGLGAGIFLSVRAQKRIEEVNARVQRIIAGELRQRLPTRSTHEPFDKLAAIVNGMLDEIETLIQSLAGVGDDIAHDLRTPLTRVRITLERSRTNALSLSELQGAVDQAITGIDHALSIITALLRIREIEQTRRLEGFDNVALSPLVREVGDLYEPFADEKHIALNVKADADVTVRGDRDLLFEAVANLVDNAVKFTPEGGKVELSVARLERDGIVRVSDTGPGVTSGERELIAQRFYRSDKSRHTRGLGLGLSLVAAIVKLHGFRFNIEPGPGFVAEIAFRLANK